MQMDCFGKSRTEIIVNNSLRWHGTYFKLGDHGDCLCQMCKQGIRLPDPQEIVRDEMLMTVWEDIMKEIELSERF